MNSSIFAHTIALLGDFVRLRDARDAAPLPTRNHMEAKNITRYIPGYVDGCKLAYSSNYAHITHHRRVSVGPSRVDLHCSAETGP